MKTVRKNTLAILYLFFFAMLFQSCLVYKRPIVTINEATDGSGYNFKKIKTLEGKVFHMKRIEIRENQVYGSNTKKGELKKLGFSVGEIESIKLQNKELSNAGNGLIVIGVVTLVILFKINQEFGLWF